MDIFKLKKAQGTTRPRSSKKNDQAKINMRNLQYRSPSDLHLSLDQLLNLSQSHSIDLVHNLPHPKERTQKIRSKFS